MLIDATKNNFTPPQVTPINRQQPPETADYAYAGGYMNFIAQFRWAQSITVPLCV